MKYILTILLIPIIALLSIQNALADNNLLLFENFDTYEGSIPPDWTKIDTDGKGTANKFIVQNGRLGLTSTTTSTIGDIIAGNTSWTDYTFSFDMISFSGADRNVLFRWMDSQNRMGFHISGNIFRIEKVIPLSERSKPGNQTPMPTVDLTGKMPHNMTHKFEISLIKRHIVIRLKNDLVDEVIIDFTDPNEYAILGGAVGLRVGTGAVAPSSVWFDNVEVRSLEPASTGLGIGHLSQRDSQWKDLEYDHASSANPTPTITIGDWGCALTSATMILNYHGFTYGPQGQNSNPVNLNTYLNENSGYTANGGVKWSSFTQYAKQAKLANQVSEDTKLLELSYPVAYDLDILKDDLQAKQPVILKLAKNSNTHFVVANEVSLDNQIYINDPWDTEYQKVSISERYPDMDIVAMARFTPSNTDLSYIWIYQTNPQVSMLVEHMGQKTGVDESGEYQEIPGAIYFEETPLSLPPNFETTYGNGQSVQVFALPKPASGEYTVTFSSSETQTAQVEFDLFDQNAQSWQHQVSPQVGKNIQATYNLSVGEDFNQSPPQIHYETSYDQFIKLIVYAYNQKMITKKSTRTVLLAQTILAQKFQKILPKVSQILFLNIDHTLEKESKKSITQEGYKLLSSEYTALKTTLGY